MLHEHTYTWRIFFKLVDSCLFHSSGLLTCVHRFKDNFDHLIYFFNCARLVTKGTVDENVYEIAKRKLILDAAVLESGVEVENEGEMPDKTMAEILSSLLLQ